jgi:hypothetical protein
MFALMQTAHKGLYLSEQALKKSQASFLIEEGVEAVKSIRDNNWTTIDEIIINTPYYLFFNTTTNSWQLNNTSTTSLAGHIPVYPLDGVFNRTVTFYDVERDSYDDIVETGGSVDSHTKKVKITVTWPTSNGEISKDLFFYITDIFN